MFYNKSRLKKCLVQVLPEPTLSSVCEFDIIEYIKSKRNLTKFTIKTLDEFGHTHDLTIQALTSSDVINTKTNQAHQRNKRFEKRQF